MLRYKPYIDQTLPDYQQALLIHHDDETAVLFAAVARKAANRALAGEPLRTKEPVTWVTPTFLAVMQRSEWTEAPGQGAALALWFTRADFDDLLRQAVPTRYEASFGERAAWRAALDETGVLAQWEARRDVDGMKLKQRVLWLGLRGDTRESLALHHVEDITEFVRQQAQFRDEAMFLLTPAETLYPAPAGTTERLGLDKSTTE